MHGWFNYINESQRLLQIQRILIIRCLDRLRFWNNLNCIRLLKLIIKRSRFCSYLVRIKQSYYYGCVNIVSFRYRALSWLSCFSSSCKFLNYCWKKPSLLTSIDHALLDLKLKACFRYKAWFSLLRVLWK